MVSTAHNTYDLCETTLRGELINHYCVSLFEFLNRSTGQVMIRPRTGDFLYSDYEFSIMSEDIHIFKEAGAEGVVFGVLTAEGWVDKERTKRFGSRLRKSMDTLIT